MLALMSKELLGEKTGQLALFALEGQKMLIWHLLSRADGQSCQGEVPR